MNLFDRSDSRPLHFVGVGGAGMSGLALVALRKGIAVTGTDADLSGSSDLVARGAALAQGSSVEMVANARTVIASAAIASDHPDLVAANLHNIPVIPRKRALADLIGDATCVAIAGTHGKTTTTVMTTLALNAAGLEPTGLAGGRVDSWGGNAWLGRDDLYVVEADEYDQAFLTLTPSIAVINNVEPDHLECYGSLAAMEAAYVKFATPARRVLIGNDGEGAERVASSLAGTTVWRFGPLASDVALDDLVLEPESSRATVRFPRGKSTQVELSVPGRHNLRNAAAALGVVAALDGNVDAAARALADFRGVGRRFERLGESRGVVFVDDYAHHPTELVATLAAARQAYPDRRLVAVFQPHLFSRTAEHGKAMGEALAVSDLVVITDVYPAREKPLPGITGKIVADEAAARGVRVIYQPDRASLNRTVAKELQPGDLLLTMGAGDVTRVGRELLAR